MNCNFGPYLTRALRDQFVGGVKSQSTRKKLLSEDRTFDQALKFARADELAEKESRHLVQNSDSHTLVHGVQVKQAKLQPMKSEVGGEAKKCYSGCGSTQHLANKCKHIKTICNFCKKTGHFG